MRMKRKNPENLEAKFLAVLEPLSKEAPCGQDLEYHPDLLVLSTRLSPQEQAQYGDFKAPSEQVNWREAQDRLMELLVRGKDLRALILLLRCRMQQAGAQGAYEGFYLLAQVLQQYGAHVHPQHCTDGVHDPSVRANVLAELSNPQTVLADLRGLLIDTASASRLSVRDVERALALPHASDAMPAESVQLQLSTLWQQQHESLRLLVKVRRLVLEICQWVDQDLHEDAPDLASLRAVLTAFDEQSLCQPEGVFETAEDALSISSASNTDEQVAVDHNSDKGRSEAAPEVSLAGDAPKAAETLSGTDWKQIRSRQDAKQLLCVLRQWFERSEPSSPVADLLHQAEFLIGKPYHEVADAIPLDLLGRWRQGR